MNKWFWLSFADPSLPEGEQFLGAVVVAVNDRAIDMIDTLDPTDRIELLRSRGQENDVPFYAATQVAAIAGLNPGGEVKGWEITDDIGRVPKEMRNRLLTREEWEAAGVPLKRP